MRKTRVQMTGWKIDCVKIESNQIYWLSFRSIAFKVAIVWVGYQLSKNSPYFQPKHICQYISILSQFELHNVKKSQIILVETVYICFYIKYIQLKGSDQHL